MKQRRGILFGLCLSCLSSLSQAATPAPISPVKDVDLRRYMGAWYVIASIPTRFETDAYNAVETYTLEPGDEVKTVFQFRRGSFDAPLKTIGSTGYVTAGTGDAVWGVKVFWFFRAQYIIAYLKADYSQVIVARDARDYVWVMARTPTLSQADYDSLIGRVKQLGYPVDKIRKVPQQWPETAGDARHGG